MDGNYRVPECLTEIQQSQVPDISSCLLGKMEMGRVSIARAQGMSSLRVMQCSHAQSTTQGRRRLRHCLQCRGAACMNTPELSLHHLAQVLLAAEPCSSNELRTD